MSNCKSIVIPWTVACQASLSMGFPRQDYWRRLPFPSSGDLPDPGIKPSSPVLACGFSTTEPPRKPFNCLSFINYTNFNASIVNFEI